MTHKMLASVAFGIALLCASEMRAQVQPGGGGGGGNCVTCVNTSETTQDCEQIPGSGAAACTIFYEVGQRWCNWSGTCTVDDFSILDVTAAGTVVSPFTRTLDDGT